MEKSVDELLQLSKVLVEEYLYAYDISDELYDQMMLLKLTLGVKMDDITKELAEFSLIKHGNCHPPFQQWRFH